MSRRVGIACAGLLAGACAVGPDYHAPEVKLPPAYAQAMPRKADARAIDPALWWHAIGDAQLDALVDEALSGNPELAMALARLQQARTFEVAVTGVALPRAVAASGGGRGTGANLVRGGRVPTDLHDGDFAASGTPPVLADSGFDAVWDLDLSGRLRRAIEASHDDAQAAAAARDAVQVSLIADVVRAYFDLRGAQTQVAVLVQNVRAAQDLLDLVQARFDRGITNELDVTLARRQLTATQAELAPRQAQAEAARDALAVLLGRFPEELALRLDAPGVIPSVPESLSTGQPIDLLRRRPDVRLAEWELAGATARIGVAVGNLFPQLALGAATGVEAQGFGNHPTMHTSIWSVGYSAGLPLLDFGALDALVNVADLRAQEQLLRYKQTVLSAVQDVDTAAASFLAQEKRLSSLGEAAIAAQRATALASERFDRGLTDFLNVVDAQRQEYELQAQYAAAQTAVGEQYVALYRALGGGWEQSAEPPAPRSSQPAVLAMFKRLIQPAPYLGNVSTAETH
jgi:NodT family efflux transporter outer membrane factor (OMF) lipoprotein